MYKNLTIIVPAQIVAQARAMSAQFPSAQKMYERALSLASAPTVPVAYISSGPIGVEFAAILPLSEWAIDEDGEWKKTGHLPGQAAAVAAQVGAPVAAVQAIFDACDVSEQTADEAMARRGLVFTVEAE